MSILQIFYYHLRLQTLGWNIRSSNRICQNYPQLSGWHAWPMDHWPVHDGISGQSGKCQGSASFHTLQSTTKIPVLIGKGGMCQTTCDVFPMSFMPSSESENTSSILQYISYNIISWATSYQLYTSSNYHKIDWTALCAAQQQSFTRHKVLAAGNTKSLEGLSRAPKHAWRA